MIIREAVLGDETAVMNLIHELAIYEKAPEEVFATASDIRDSLFQEHPVAFCHVVEVDGAVVGIALWFLNYSTWLGKPGLYLEDLFVLEEHRGNGYGMALLKTLANLAVERDYERFQWWVLDWNQPSIDLYLRMGAVPMDEWTTFRLSGDALRKFAE